MACFLLFTAFTDEVAELSGVAFTDINLGHPPVFLSGILGSTLVYFFSGRCMTAVGAAAQEVVDAVRQQFAERPGIMARTEKPDYTRCVAIVTAAAQREMVFPGLVSVCAPLVNGYFWRVLGSNELLQLSDRPDPLLGAKCTASFLMFATASGVLQALFLNTAGGAWDNAKKYIESGVFGGKGSDAHKAAVTGDTVGDPAKDTAGPRECAEVPAQPCSRRYAALANPQRRSLGTLSAHRRLPWGFLQRSWTEVEARSST